MDTALETSRGWSACVSLSVPIRAELSWRATDHPGELELLVSGELCVWTVSCIEPALGGLVSDRRPTTVTLDLSGVTFIDARGVSLLSRLAQHLASWDGSLAITRPSHVVTRLLALVGIDRDLRVVCPTGSHDGHAERPQVALGEYGSVGRL